MTMHGLLFMLAARKLNHLFQEGRAVGRILESGGLLLGTEQEQV